MIPRRPGPGQPLDSFLASHLIIVMKKGTYQQESSRSSPYAYPSLIFHIRQSPPGHPSTGSSTPDTACWAQLGSSRPVRQIRHVRANEGPIGGGVGGCGGRRRHCAAMLSVWGTAQGSSKVESPRMAVMMYRRVAILGGLGCDGTARTDDEDLPLFGQADRGRAHYCWLVLSQYRDLGAEMVVVCCAKC